jgi:DNA-binding transcriptional ArsR family regulator
MAPCTVRELASSLDVAPDSLYYHVRQLQRIGLLAVSERRNGNGRPEVELRARRYHIAYDLANSRSARAVLNAGRTIVRQSQRDFALGVRDPRATPRGPVRNLWALRLEASLGAGEVRRINRHLAAILKVLRGSRREPSQGLTAVSWVLAPIPSGGRTKRRFQGAKRSAR